MNEQAVHLFDKLRTRAQKTSGREDSPAGACDSFQRNNSSTRLDARYVFPRLVESLHLLTSEWRKIAVLPSLSLFHHTATIRSTTTRLYSFLCPLDEGVEMRGKYIISLLRAPCAYNVHLPLKLRMQCCHNYFQQVFCHCQPFFFNSAYIWVRHVFVKNRLPYRWLNGIYKKFVFIFSQSSNLFLKMYYEPHSPVCITKVAKLYPEIK